MEEICFVSGPANDSATHMVNRMVCSRSNVATIFSKEKQEAHEDDKEATSRRPTGKGCRLFQSSQNVSSEAARARERRMSTRE